MSRTTGAHQLLLFLLTCVILSFASQSLAVSAADILQPYKDEQEVCKQALRDLERQAGLQIEALHAHKVFLEKRLESLTAAEAMLGQEHEATLKVMDRAVLTGWQLIQDMEDMIHVPGQGFLTMEQLLQRRDTLRQEVRQTWESVEKGEREFDIPGLGMVSRTVLQAAVTSQEERIEELKAEIEQGVFVVHHPVFGLVDRHKLEKHAAYLAERIATVQDEITRGDYPVVLPHLGPTTRNQLDAQIMRLKEQAKNLTQNFKDGLVTILRGGSDTTSVHSRQWIDQKTLQQDLDTVQAKQQEIARLIKENGYPLELPGGALTTAALKEKIAGLRDEIEGLEARLSDKSYTVALDDGTWATERELDKALVNALLAPEIRKRLDMGRKSITVSAKAEMLMRSLEKVKFEQWLKDFDTFAKQHLEVLGHDLAWKKTLLREFVTEQKIALDALNGKILWMERYKRYIP